MKLNDFVLPAINLKTNELCPLNMAEIERYEKRKKITVALIGDDEWSVGLSDLDEIEKHFMKFDLWLTDRVNVVNLNKVVKLDEEWSRLYFANSNRPASIAKVHLEVVRTRLIEMGIHHEGSMRFSAIKNLSY